ncbi:MAG: GatB/YqeY domain-containing protein [Candidatus Pacebacteria bacterium]|nr:GatB/YqeY domain-containing protein [Candidatus Paceibacterota bacterium]MCF7857128.1 GatB/YqeY domain-containing protein [Candidatus Paceibacterota bacterium]
MELHTQIKEELKTAMKAHDAVKLRTVRGMLTAFTNELVATGSTPQGMLPDENVLGVIKRLAKQRKESIVQYEAAGRTDLSEPEKEELVVLNSYLPQMMSRDEIRPVVAKKISELGDVDKTKIGILIGSLMKEFNGKAEGGDIKAVVEELLAK